MKRAEILELMRYFKEDQRWMSYHSEENTFSLKRYAEIKTAQPDGGITIERKIDEAIPCKLVKLYMTYSPELRDGRLDKDIFLFVRTSENIEPNYFYMADISLEIKDKDETIEMFDLSNVTIIHKEVHAYSPSEDGPGEVYYDVLIKASSVEE